MVNIDHELKRNIILSVGGGYTLYEYQGAASIGLPARVDDAYNFGFSAKYLINRYVYLKGAYSYNTRSSNIANSNYDLNAVYFTIGTQL